MDWKKLLEEFVAKLNEATDGKSDDEKKKVIAEATDALPQEARQHLVALGHADGAQELQKAKDAAEAEAKKAKEAADDKDAEITKLKEQLAEKQPDLAKQKAEYEGLLAEKAAENERLKTANAESLKAERLKGAKAQLVAGLSGRVISESIARALANDPDVLERVGFDDDGNVKVYASDGKTPLAVTTGQDPIAALAADVAGAQPKELLKSTADGGSGAGSGEGGPSSSEFDAIAKEVEQQYAGGGADDARKRLGWN